jgi:hypothetical protein
LICGTGDNFTHGFEGFPSDMVTVVMANTDRPENVIFTGSRGLGILTSTGDGYSLNLNAFLPRSNDPIMSDAYCLNLRAIFDVNAHCATDGAAEKLTVIASNFTLYSDSPGIFGTDAHGFY